jgi:hypothetical protein
MDLVAWFRNVWPRQKRAVMREYMQMRELQFVLADIALRGGVNAKIPNAANDRQAAVLEGRRQLALEILHICGMEAGRLHDIVERSDVSKPKDD